MRSIADQKRLRVFRKSGVPMTARTSRAKLAQVAYAYYVQGKGQAEIADQLGISRSNISRILRLAREQGIVRFEISFPVERSVAAERQILDAYGSRGLREAIVVARDDDDDSAGSNPQLAVARASVDWLATGLRDGSTLGLAWGGTVQTVVDIAHFSRSIDVHVVQLVGELSLDPRNSGHDLVRDLAVQIGGRYTYFNAPAVLPMSESADALLHAPQVSSALALARSAAVSLLGLGRYNVGSSAVFLALANATAEEHAEADAAGVVGQALGRFFDGSGAQADLSIHRRIISLDIQDLKSIPTNVIVASGREKAEAVVAGLMGGWIDVLIIDAALAGAVSALPAPEILPGESEMPETEEVRA